MDPGFVRGLGVPGRAGHRPRPLLSHPASREGSVGMVMSKVAMRRVARYLPEPPPRRTRRLPWREVGFVAGWLGIRESPDRPEGVPLYGLVPVGHGRASLV